MDLITETSLEALLQRATDNRNKNTDTAAIDAFCGIIKKERDGPLIASKLIASKIQSTEEWEALQGLTVLESCMKKCGSAFHSEIGKFKFLNEMIKLVSPKFLGVQTPDSVKNKILSMMHDWSLNYPKEHKIKEAYDMLVKQGLIEKSDFTSGDGSKSPLRSKTLKQSNLFQNEEKAKLLQKLLHSKNPNDLQAANKLIKTMVREDERRMELMNKKVSEIEHIRNNVKLLSEMLGSYVSSHSSNEELELISELHESCERFRQNIIDLASEAQDKDEFLNQVITVGDDLDQVLKKYKDVFDKDKSTKKNSNLTSNLCEVPALLDLSAPIEELKAVSLENGININGSLDSVDPLIPALKIPEATNNRNEFTSDSLNALLSPLNIQNNAGPSFTQSSSADKKVVERNRRSKALDELDILGETLLQQFKVQALPKESNEELKTVSSDSQCESSVQEDNNKKSCMNVEEKFETESHINESLCINSSSKNAVLKDIFVSFDSIKPSSVPPISIIEEKNGMSVVIYAAEGTPKKDVTVFVVTTINKNPHPVTNYLFQAVVSEGCKLKLQPQSASELPAHHPFLPPSAITQIMLIFNPLKMKITLKCMISYTLEKESYTEMGEVKELMSLT